MRRGWITWVVGNLLAITALMFVPAFAFASESAYPPLPFSFYAIYGTLAAGIATGAALLMWRGWRLSHLPPVAATAA